MSCSERCRCCGACMMFYGEWVQCPNCGHEEELAPCEAVELEREERAARRLDRAQRFREWEGR